MFVPSDCHNLVFMADRTHRELSDDNLQQIASAYHCWRADEDEEYQDIPGFCKAASLDEIRKNGYVLTPGGYVGTAPDTEDQEPFEEKMARLTQEQSAQLPEGRRLEDDMVKNLRVLGYDL